MNFFELLGRNIAEILREKEMSQTELAEKMNISKQVMSKIVNGQKAINALEIKKIADVLGTDLNRLMEDRVSEVDGDESLAMLMGNIANSQAKDTLRFLNDVIDELIFMEDLLHE